MNTKFDPNGIVVYISDDQSGDLDVINETTVHSSNENGEQEQPFQGNTAPGDFNIKLITDIAKILIIDEKWDDFGEMIGQFNDENFRTLMENETFLRMYLQYKMHLGHLQDIFHILENVQDTNDPVLLQLWDQAHYKQYREHGGTLTSIHKFRVRQRNPPPAGICPGGLRPAIRLSESSAVVLREWFAAHSQNPYPCRKTKLALAIRAGVSVAKVTTWFANTRRKCRKALQKKSMIKDGMNMDTEAEIPVRGPTIRTGWTSSDDASTKLVQYMAENTDENKSPQPFQYDLMQNHRYGLTENHPHIVTTDRVRPSVKSETDYHDENVHTGLVWQSVGKWSIQQENKLGHGDPFNLTSHRRVSSNTAQDQRMAFSVIQLRENGQFERNERGPGEECMQVAYNSRKQCDARMFDGDESRHCLPNYMQDIDNDMYTRCKIPVQNNTSCPRSWNIPFHNPQSQCIPIHIPVYNPRSQYIPANKPVYNPQSQYIPIHKPVYNPQSQYIPANKPVYNPQSQYIPVYNHQSQNIPVHNPQSLNIPVHKLVYVPQSQNIPMINATDHLKSQTFPMYTTADMRHNKSNKLPKVICYKDNPVNVGKMESLLHGYKPIHPKPLKSIGQHSKTKVKNIKSVWKLRLKLKERQHESVREKYNSDSIRSRLESLKCLQELCDKVESLVQSPVDFACTIQFKDHTDSDEDIGCEEHDAAVNDATATENGATNAISGTCMLNGARNTLNSISATETGTTNADTCNITSLVDGAGNAVNGTTAMENGTTNADNGTIYTDYGTTATENCIMNVDNDTTYTDNGRDMHNVAKERSSRNCNYIIQDEHTCYSCEERKAKNSTVQPAGGSSVEKGVDLTVEGRYSDTNMSAYTVEEEDVQKVESYIQTGQLVPCSPNMLNIYNESDVTGNQYFRLAGGDGCGVWHSLYGHLTKELSGRLWMEADSVDYYSPGNCGDYSTVVGEAIQGLLNLSSSQESEEFD